MQLSISKQTGIIVSLALSVTLVVMVTAMLIVQSRSILKSTSDEVNNLGDFMVKSLTFAMSQGSTDVGPFIQSVKGLRNLVQLRVTPVDLSKGGTTSAMDADERWVVNTGETKGLSQDFNGQKVFRVIEPVKADEKCTTCHGGKPGDILAVVSMRYSLADMESSLATQRLAGILFALLAIAVTFIMSMYFIKRRIVADLDRSVESIRKLSDGDASETAVVKRNDEIGNLNLSLSRLRETLSDRAEIGTRFAEGDIRQEVNLLSDRDVLGKAFRKLKESLENLVSDGKALSEAAVEGRLHERSDSGRHQGEFREIIVNFNKTLDAIVGPIDESKDVLEKMSQGDMSARMNGKYQGDYATMKESLEFLGNSICSALIEVQSTTHSTTAAASQISSSSEEMAAGAQEQSAQANEVAAAVEEMTKTILETSRNSSTAAESARQAGALAREGGTAVSDTILGMKRIAASVRKSAETVTALGKSSEEIGKIIQVIDDIADQTNLLALNAAIEAARAGEQGRGFAVVADEVRKLAERTTAATKEIAAMIKQIQNDTTIAVGSMEEGTAEVDKGMKLTDKAGQSLQNIITAAGRVVDVVTQVAAASEEQSSTAEQISKNIETISHVTGENAAGVQQIAHASEDLSRLTLNLQEMVSRFNVGESKDCRDTDKKIARADVGSRSRLQSNMSGQN